MNYSRVADQWFSPIQVTPQTSCVLFCFPYAGGGTGIFRHWPDFLSSDILARPIQFPGREARIHEAPYTHVLPLVEAIAEAIAAQCRVPFAFFGHSMGAFLSFEVANYLHLHYQREPVHLFVSAQRAPHLPPKIPYPSSTLSDADLVDVLRQVGGIPASLFSNALLMRFLLPSIRADLAVCSDYQYKEGLPLNCPISVFGGEDDHQANFSDLEAWKRYTLGSFGMQMWKGGHFFLQQEQERLVATIQTAILHSLSRSK
ncbi:thioesterase II family protein [Ktedonobacter robiniae]|uniref:thioesterase II family protein n=1 Tax=Ktedonobacter robiniae TaxID=2778365 RepID=UPI0019160839|nr:thioesterase [Ktedonobacter robiniae]